MLDSGWIMPDGTEISTNNHAEIVESFILGLQFQKTKLKDTINNAIYEFLKDKDSPKYFFPDLGVKLLGWIKVGCYTIKIITYGGFKFQNSFVISYLHKGAYDDNQHLNEDIKNYSLILINCDWKDIIETGESLRGALNLRHSDNYLPDFFTDASGNIQYFPWSKEFNRH